MVPSFHRTPIKIHENTAITMSARNSATAGMPSSALPRIVNATMGAERSAGSRRHSRRAGRPAATFISNSISSARSATDNMRSAGASMMSR